MANKEIDAFAADAAVTGVEVLVVSDAGTGKKVTVDQLVAFAIDEIEAIAASPTLDSGDSVMILENDAVLKPVTYEVLENSVAETMYAEAASGSVIDTDVMLKKDGGVTKGTFTAVQLATYMLAALEPSILDITDLAANATPADADLVMICDGSTPKKTTWLQLKTQVMAGLQAYVLALGAAGAGGDTDIIYVSQAGVQKKMTLLQLATYIGISVTTTGGIAGNLAAWVDADTLDASISLVPVATGFSGAGSDTAVPTTAAVRGEMKTIVSDQSALTAIADADTILVDDGDAGVPTKSTFTKVWTWLWAKVSGATNKAVIIDADSIGIVDSAASDVVKNSTFTNVWTWIASKLPSYAGNLTSVATISTSAGITGGTSINAASSLGTQGKFTLGLVTPTQITANTNNWNPGAYSFIRLDSDGAYDITGMVADTGEGRADIRIIVNIVAGSQTFKHLDGSSDASRQFVSTTGSDIVLAQNELLFCIYDDTDSKWRISKI